ncbi:M15 family metallopeptidase [Vannielia litorea]|uniref:M15 family metallopeptidase n=1 Tax=Vannielia litorea TaxID=1217970 RepID=UPI0011152055|nr:M15 family metallopeptidase [Vannielia litorea]
MSAAACEVRDFLALPLPAFGERPAIAVALELAYPGLQVDEAKGSVRVSGTVLPLGQDAGRPPRERLADPSIAEMFSDAYPLAFDLDQRLTPWNDPGRARHEGLMRALYGQSEKEVAGELLRTDYRGAGRSARFSASGRYCVAPQLQAALDAIAAEGPEMDRFFNEVGGSFNWRVVAGTGRLSAHSFGIAVDFNTALGGYWRWSGAKEGDAGRFDNTYPEALVRQMERFGFIWGGKWHHFDGMHFEYRPELILHARLRKDPGAN